MRLLLVVLLVACEDDDGSTAPPSEVCVERIEDCPTIDEICGDRCGVFHECCFWGRDYEGTWSWHTQFIECFCPDGDGGVP